MGCQPSCQSDSSSVGYGNLQSISRLSNLAVAMYLAELTYPGTAELVSDLLIDAPESAAREFSLQHASIWGLELFSLTQATDQQVQLHKAIRPKTLALIPA